VICANHFLTAGLREYPRNRGQIEEATSASREKRLTDLLVQRRGSLGPTETAEILRDRKLPGGQFAGNGNRGALNAGIATHATIMDLTDGIFWAASPPHQLGAFVAFDVQDFEHELPLVRIPEDAAIASKEYARAKESAQCLTRARHALKQKNAITALELADKAEVLNPGFYENAILRGKALLALDRKADAVQAFEKALAAKPAFLKERKEIESLLERAKTSSL
jgi:tetratricopeptide (TPR) repeat protein